MDKGKISDLVCAIGFAVLIVMTIEAVLVTNRATYEVNTGFFCAFFCLIPLIFRRLNIMTLPLAFVLMIEVSIILHGYGVLLARYDFVQIWDTVTHSISSITVALCVFYALLVIDAFDNDVNITRKWMPIFIFILMMTFSTYWEVFELVVDELWGTNMQYSPWDTVRDLVCDTFGALVVSLYSYWYLGRTDGTHFLESLNMHPYVKRLGGSTE